MSPLRKRMTDGDEGWRAQFLPVVHEGPPDERAGRARLCVNDPGPQGLIERLRASGRAPERQVPVSGPRR